MDGWMVDGRMDGRMDGQMDGWMDELGQTKGRETLEEVGVRFT